MDVHITRTMATDEYVAKFTEWINEFAQYSNEGHGNYIHRMIVFTFVLMESRVFDKVVFEKCRQLLDQTIYNLCMSGENDFNVVLELRQSLAPYICNADVWPCSEFWHLRSPILVNAAKRVLSRWDLSTNNMRLASVCKRSIQTALWDHLKPYWSGTSYDTYHGSCLMAYDNARSLPLPTALIALITTCDVYYPLHSIVKEICRAGKFAVIETPKQQSHNHAWNPFFVRMPDPRKLKFPRSVVQETNRGFVLFAAMVETTLAGRLQYDGISVPLNSVNIFSVWSVWHEAVQKRNQEWWDSVQNDKHEPFMNIVKYRPCTIL